MTDHIGETNEMVLSDQELNEAVAKKLGYTLQEVEGSEIKLWCKYSDPNGWPVPRNYCHSIQAAWEIVEYLRPKGIEICISCDSALTPSPRWYCQFGPNGLGQPGLIDHEADTAPRAICEAFLKL